MTRKRSHCCSDRNRSRSLLIPMSTLRPSSTSTTSTWIRWMPLWHGLFSMSLVLATGIALVEGLHTWQQTGVLLGLSLVFGLWYTVSVVISPLSWQARPLLTMAYLAGGWSLWFGLTVLDPSYLFVLFGLYPQVFVLAPLPGKILGALLLTALCAWQQVTLAGSVETSFSRWLPGSLAFSWRCS